MLGNHTWGCAKVKIAVTRPKTTELNGSPLGPGRLWSETSEYWFEPSQTRAMRVSKVSRTDSATMLKASTVITMAIPAG